MPVSSWDENSKKDVIPDSMTEFMLECRHKVRISTRNFMILRKLAAKHKTTWRNPKYCHKCEKNQQKV